MRFSMVNNIYFISFHYNTVMNFCLTHAIHFFMNQKNSYLGLHCISLVVEGGLVLEFPHFLTIDAFEWGHMDGTPLYPGFEAPSKNG